MSRKHYEAIATILRQSYAPRDVVKAFADAFAADNPRFDKARFIAACKPLELA